MTSAAVIPSAAALSGFQSHAMVGKILYDCLTTFSSEITSLQGTGGALDWKNSCKAATTGNLVATRTANVLTADAVGALAAQDGVTMAVDDRLLVKNQSTGADNGIYTVTSLGAGGAAFVLTRATDADSSAEVTPELFVMVEQGTVNQDKGFILDVDGAITLNTTALTFVDFRGLAITAPADVTKAAAAVGTSTTVARSDHKHDVSTAVAGAVAIGDAAGEGAATSLARSDHTHTVAGGSPVAVGLANADGAGTTFARSNHVHANGNQRGQVTLASGVGLVNTGVTVTANTRAVPILVTPGAGAPGTRYAVSYSAGGPGVGSITITAKDSNAGNNTVATDDSVIDWVAFEAAAV
jgi:hypothetical protein